MDVWKIRLILLCIFLYSFVGIVSAQTNFLINKINISVSQASLEEVLMLISEEGDFNFSYNADVINGDSLVSLNVRNKSVEKALNELFGKSIKYKIVGSHVVLLPEVPKANKRNQRKNLGMGGYTITGYIFDAQTGQTLQNATVYEINGKISGITNSQGFYSIVVPSDRELKGLTYCHYHYHDTIILLRPQKSMKVDITLRPREKELQKIQSKTIVLEHDIHERNIVNMFVPEEAQINARNLSVLENVPVQFSILPFIGTNSILGGTETNRLSINLLAGYTGSVDGVELGGFLNIVKNDVKGAQLAGFGNIVGKKTEGLQGAGFFNVNAGDMKGAQLAGFHNTLNGDMVGIQGAGFSNVTTENVDGVQLAGFVNVAFKDVELVQASGFGNYARDVNGAQLAGFGNIAFGNVEAAQVAGFFNAAKDVNGAQLAGYLNLAHGNVNMVQAAGLANYAKNVNNYQLAGLANLTLGDVGKGQLAGFFNYSYSNSGLQLAGFTNITIDESEGYQISSIFNHTGILNGYQIGLVNFCDTVESGTPIGLLSFARRGFHPIEISTNEFMFANFTLRTGTHTFYNVFEAGMGYADIIHPAYGVGTLKEFKHKHIIGAELTAGAILEKNNSYKAKGNLVSFDLYYGFRFKKHLAIIISPSLNYYVDKLQYGEREFLSFAPYTLVNEVENEFLHQLWIGGSIGLRF